MSIYKAFYANGLITALALLLIQTNTILLTVNINKSLNYWMSQFRGIGLTYARVEGRVRRA